MKNLIFFICLSVLFQLGCANKSSCKCGYSDYSRIEIKMKKKTVEKILHSTPSSEYGLGYENYRVSIYKDESDFISIIYDENNRVVDSRFNKKYKD